MLLYCKLLRVCTMQLHIMNLYMEHISFPKLDTTPILLLFSIREKNYYSNSNLFPLVISFFFCLDFLSLLLKLKCQQVSDSVCYWRCLLFFLVGKCVSFSQCIRVYHKTETTLETLNRKDLILGMKCLGFPGDSDGKESTCNAGDLGSIPALGRSPGGRHSNPLQYSCLQNPMDRGAWRATVHGVMKLDMTEWQSIAHMKCLWK